MANLDTINVGGTNYDICDKTARDSVSQSEKFDPPTWQAQNTIKNFLLISGDAKSPNNMPESFGSETPATTFTNCPYTAGPFYGYRLVFSTAACTLFIVELHEIYPVSGRIWTNTYDSNRSSWYGWRALTPTSA